MRLLWACAFLAVIEGQVARLGDKKFKVREGAHQALQSAGRLAKPALERAAGHPDPEVRRRAEMLRAPWAEEMAEAKSRRILPRDYDRLPWMCYWAVPWEAFRHYCNEGDKALPWGQRGAPDYLERREATRLWVRDQIYAKRPRREILDTLDLMVYFERAGQLAW